MIVPTAQPSLTLMRVPIRAARIDALLSFPMVSFRFGIPLQLSRHVDQALGAVVKGPGDILPGRPQNGPPSPFLEPRTVIP